MANTTKAIASEGADATKGGCVLENCGNAKTAKTAGCGKTTQSRFLPKAVVLGKTAKGKCCQLPTVCKNANE